MIVKDFEVFYQQKDPEDAFSTLHCPLRPTQVSTSQEGVNIPEGMVFEERTPDLLALLTAHARGASLPISVVPRPLTPTLTRASFSDAAKKKRKKGQGGKGLEGTEEGEITHSSQQPPAKEARTTRAQQKKGASFGTSKESEEVQLPKPSAWRPSFTLSSGGLVMDNANLKDHQKGRSGLVAECLEKALCPPRTCKSSSPLGNVRSSCL